MSENSLKYAWKNESIPRKQFEDLECFAVGGNIFPVEIKFWDKSVLRALSTSL